MKQRILYLLYIFFITASSVTSIHYYGYDRFVIIFYILINFVLLYKYFNYPYTCFISNFTFLFLFHSYFVHINFNDSNYFGTPVFSSLYGLLIIIMVYFIFRLIQNINDKFLSRIKIFFYMSYIIFTIFIIYFTSFHFSRSFADYIIPKHPGFFVDLNYLSRNIDYSIEGCGFEDVYVDKERKLYSWKINDVEIVDSIIFAFVVSKDYPYYCYKYFLNFKNDSILQTHINIKWENTHPEAGKIDWTYRDIKNNTFWNKFYISDSIWGNGKVTYMLMNVDFLNNEIIYKLITILYKHTGGSI